MFQYLKHIRVLAWSNLTTLHKKSGLDKHMQITMVFFSGTADGIGNNQYYLQFKGKEKSRAQLFKALLV